MAEAPLDPDAAGLFPPPDMPQPETVESPVEDESGLNFTGGGSPVLIRDRYLIDPGKPLPEYNSLSAKAFAVEDRRDLGRRLMGLVCTPGLPVRLNFLNSLPNTEVRGILPLIDWDTEMWPPLDQTTLIVIFQRPFGRVIDKINSGEVRITEYDLARVIVEPLIEGMERLAQMDGPLRAIRHDNLFFIDEGLTEVVVGNFVTAPAGYDQPPIFEPLERSMAMPAGRGVGDSRDDVFALGVTLIHLMIDRLPSAKLKADELVRQRCETGSYTAIYGNSRIPLRMIEPIRGMLNDDPFERWGVEQILNWTSGHKDSSISKKPILKADLEFTFRGTTHISPRTLARQFARHPVDAVRTAGEESFYTWLKRHLGQPGLADTIKGIIKTGKFHAGTAQGSDDFTLTRISMALDPPAPIRYRGLEFMPDGYGPMLATEWVRNNNPQPAAEILSNDIPGLWFAAQTVPATEYAELQKTFARIKALLSIQDPGYGLERVLYEFNPGIACQSPLIAKKYVIGVSELLPALDEASKGAAAETQPVDRHIAAFVPTRFDQDVHPHLRALASPNRDTEIIGVLSLLAFLQWKLKTPTVLGLSSWIGGMLGPAIEAYHNRYTREEIEKEIPRLVRKGSLPELFNLIDNAEKRQEDTDGYEIAKLEWLEAEEEIRDIEGSGNERITRAERAGRQAAAMISITLALTVVSVLLLIQLV